MRCTYVQLKSHFVCPSIRPHEIAVAAAGADAAAAAVAVGVSVQFRCSGGICALRRVLRGFAAARPGVGYCQGLNFLAGTLLLFQEQELALASLLQLVVSNDKNKGTKGNTVNHLLLTRADGLGCTYRGAACAYTASYVRCVVCALQCITLRCMRTAVSVQCGVCALRCMRTALYAAVCVHYAH